ncbi:MAG TPA: 5-methyltetrahydropteroyltriglutamate--homocysteine methyltransferase, partial [Pseudogracilibacillus sp.]|nr:5-methyltetrahydropteroyltriglutamate--homocysteine methyltransferase [Pseudogracilibacillus sp.]
IEENGYDAQKVTQVFADTTVKALEDKPEDMTITIHICRGNFKSSWLYEGDYELIAKDLFSRVNVDGFFLEFDSDRAGDFTPLRFIKNQKVVLGLITTKTAELEDKTEIKQRIEEATQVVPKEQLCISPQCGFASTEEGNLLTEADQWNKLQLVLDIAKEVWGDLAD